MSAVDVRLVNADAFKVGPDEVLIVQLPQDAPVEVFTGLTEALEQLGLGGRSLVLGLDVPLTVVKKDEATQRGYFADGEMALPSHVRSGNNDHEDDGA